MSTATRTRKGRNGQPAPTATTEAELLEILVQRTSDWSTWTKRLSARKKPQPLKRLLAPAALLWGLNSSRISDFPLVHRLVDAGKKLGQEWDPAATSWLETVDTRWPDHQLALESLAWCHALPNLAGSLPTELWNRLLAKLLQLSHDADGAGRDVESLPHVLVAGELPLALAYVLPEIDICAARRDQGRQAMARALDELLDGEGMVHAKHLDDLPSFLACGVRALTMDGEIKKGRLDKAARLQFDWMTRQTLRWSRADGTTILGSTLTDAPYFDPLLRAALDITKDASDALAHKVLRGRRKATSRTLAELPAPSEHSEWSELAILRTDWSAERCHLAVNFSHGKLDVELATHETVLFSGSSLPNIVADDKALALVSDWEEVCWESDDDMDYIELEAQLSDGWRIQRQMLLARQDRFAYMADALLGPRNGSVTYEHALPLVERVACEPAEETCETFLVDRKRAATIIPLSLPEWKTDTRHGRLRADLATLVLARRGDTLYAPLFFDLDPARQHKALTWRRLTVGESLQIVSDDVAVAYRVQIGKRQWVFYRSLGSAGNRTFLGINLTSEFLAARFTRDGEIEPLIDIAG